METTVLCPPCGLFSHLAVDRASQVAQWLKKKKKKIHLPMQETQEKQIRFPGWKYAQEEEMPTHSSILAWGTPWAEKPTGLYSPRGCKESDKTEHACTGQQVLVEGGKETIRVPRGSPCLQASSWS